MILDDKSEINILFAFRVKFHNYCGIDNLDEWPKVKVSSSISFFIFAFKA